MIPSEFRDSSRLLPPHFFVIFALLTCNFAQFREDFHAEVAE